jgi:hypothetical protein
MLAPIRRTLELGSLVMKKLLLLLLVVGLGVVAARRLRES